MSHGEAAKDEIIRLAPEEFVFREGDQGKYGYIVMAGEIEIGKTTGGKLVPLTTAKEGALFGEMALIDHAPRSAYAKALGDATVKEIDENAFKAYIMKSPDAAINMMKRLSSYVRTSNQAIEVRALDLKGKKLPETEDQNQPQKGDKHALEQAEAFESPIQEILQQGVSTPMRLTALTLIAFVVLAVLWASLCVIDTTVSARGRLATTMPTIDVQAPDSLTVRKVLAKPGQKVKKGQTLAILDPTFTEADYNTLRLDIQSNDALHARLMAEKSQQGLTAIASIGSSIQQAIYRGRMEEWKNQISSLDRGIEKATAQWQQAETNLKIAQVDLSSQQHSRSKTKRLVDEGVLHKIALKDLDYQIEKAQAKVDNAQTSVRLALQEKSASTSSKDAYLNQWFSGINQQLVGVLQKKDTLQEELNKLNRRRENSEIRSPVNGIVLELERLFVGAIVASGEVVLSLVPTDIPLRVEVDIEPKEISNVMVGQNVSIKLDALPFQKHGGLLGEITFVSEDTVDQSVGGDAGTFYRVLADISADELREKPNGFRLVPGMQLNADIRIGKRVLITYLIYPVIRTIQTSFREP
jgi:HlyD family secretion protein